MQTTYNKKEKHMKVSKKKKNNETYKFMIKYIDKFDLLVKRAQKEKEVRKACV